MADWAYKGTLVHTPTSYLDTERADGLSRGCINKRIKDAKSAWAVTLQCIELGVVLIRRHRCIVWTAMRTKLTSFHVDFFSVTVTN